MDINLQSKWKIYILKYINIYQFGVEIGIFGQTWWMPDLSMSLRHQWPLLQRKYNQRLAKRPLKTNGRLAYRRLSALPKETTGHQPPWCWLGDICGCLSSMGQDINHLNSVWINNRKCTIHSSNFMMRVGVSRLYISSISISLMVNNNKTYVV